MRSGKTVRRWRSKGYDEKEPEIDQVLPERTRMDR